MNADHRLHVVRTHVALLLVFGVRVVSTDVTRGPNVGTEQAVSFSTYSDFNEVRFEIGGSLERRQRIALRCRCLASRFVSCSRQLRFLNRTELGYVLQLGGRGRRFLLLCRGIGYRLHNFLFLGRWCFFGPHFLVQHL